MGVPNESTPAVEEYLPKAPDFRSMPEFADLANGVMRSGFDNEAKLCFLERFAYCGLQGASAQAAGVTQQAVRDAYDNDPVFQEAYQYAKEVFRNRLEAEAFRRAYEGYDRPVYNRGQLAGYERCFSDGLLQTMLKRHIPEYRDKMQLDVNGNAGGVLVLGAAAMSTDEWLISQGIEVEADSGEPSAS